MAAETIGTARVDIVVNTDDMQTGIEAAKRQMRGFEGASEAVKQELGRMTEAQRRAAEQMLRQVNTLQLGKEGMTAFRIETRTTGEVQKYLREQLAATSAAAQATGNQFAMSQKQINAAMRGVPAQITDIVVSLQGGQAPLTVLLQQGGQLRDMFGSIGGAAKALGSTILSLVNPFTLTAAAAAALIYLYNKGTAELDAYRSAIVTTGSAMGVTAGQLQVMAQHIDASVGTQMQAAEALTALVSQNATYGDMLEKNAQAAVRFSRVTGESVDKIAKSFAELKKDPLDAAIKLNEQMNFLTDATYKQIKALMEQGRTVEAARVAQNQFADSLNDQAGKMEANLGTIERAWRGVKGAIGEAVDALLNVGRKQEGLALVAKQAQTVASLEALQATGGRAYQTDRFAAQLAAAKATLTTLQEQAKVEADASAATARDAERRKALIAWDKEGVKYLSDEEKLRREILRLRNEGAAAGVEQKDIDARIKHAQEEYAKKQRGSVAAANRISKADLSADITDIQIRYRQLTTAQGNAERMLDAQRAAGLVSERDYYAQKRQFLEDNAALQIRELEEENQRYAKQSATGADKINNDKKIAQNVGKIAEIRAKAATDVAISTLQEEAANRQLEASYKALTQSMEDYLQSSRDRYQRELDGMGLGNQWRDRNTVQNQINDRYQGQRNDLRNNRELLEMAGKWNAELEQQYARRLQIINDANQKALELDADFWRRRREQQSDWFVGANEAIANYLDEVGNVAKRTENIVGSALSGLTSGITDALYEGNFDSLKSVGESITKQIMAGIVSQSISEPFAQWLKGELGQSSSFMSELFSGLFGGGKSGGGGGFLSFLFNAKGGVYDSPSLSQYSNQVHSTPKLFAFAKGAGVFAEAGPEAIMPLARGADGSLGVRAMRPQGGGGAGGGEQVQNINIQLAAQPGMSRATAMQQGADIGRGIQLALRRNT